LCFLRVTQARTGGAHCLILTFKSITVELSRPEVIC
jgi:hypothetical protein